MRLADGAVSLVTGTEVLSSTLLKPLLGTSVSHVAGNGKDCVLSLV